MHDAVSIRILEKDTNRRGDLFGRLMADLFVALGYEQPRLNIHKSGRELDLVAEHRLEPRRAIGECKATAQSIGGDDLNKFVGALDAERRDDRPLTGYFISLAGFKETALEQEKQRSTRIVTLNGAQVVEELIRGRILIPRERATELAGRQCADLGQLALDPAVELLAHERGWIWSIYYSHGKARTHVLLIHSDGTTLAHALADEIIASDRECGGELHKLTCLNPAPPCGSELDPNADSALIAYGQYLASECGYIQLDGLPADSDVGSRRMRLENLFVPLHLDLSIPNEDDEKTKRQPVGAVLAKFPRLALLAPPGGGKSTLLKRLAVAYSDPSRREQLGDDLPSRDWFPLFFRCRELRGLARGSFSELLDALAQREPVRQYAAAFRAYADRVLLDGRVLLLVDGLDEIADAGDRAAFVCTIRAALQAYPSTAAVVTSREAGFRHVAAHLAPVCVSATLSSFDEEDIRRLTVSWHREVVGDSEKVLTDAEQLAATIAGNDRISRLAINPLLLTTLLLVKRWVGSLPTKRAVLYGKAVEVLLMTWNVEGHDPIAEDEAMPQLCYVASAMMLAGQQKISRPRLAGLLQQAREELPTELGYVNGTVDQFIHRVEDRSSLLMMSGHDVEEGRLVEFFEFRHLTFQEFLTARAMVEGWHPGRKEADTLADVLEPHFAKEGWREVIPLAAVLGGKATEEVILRLSALVKQFEREPWLLRESPEFIALGNSLADEAAARPETVRSGIRALLTGQLAGAAFVPVLVRGRYGAELRDEAERVLLESELDAEKNARNLREVIWRNIDREGLGDGIDPLAEPFRAMLSKPDALVRITGALSLSCLFDKYKVGSIGKTALSQSVGEELAPLLFSELAAEQYSVDWALFVLGRDRLWTPTQNPDVVGRLFRLWRGDVRTHGDHTFALTLANQPILARDTCAMGATIARDELLMVLAEYDSLAASGQSAALILAWYLRAMPDGELMVRTQNLIKSRRVGGGVATSLEELRQHLEHGSIEANHRKGKKAKRRE